MTYLRQIAVTVTVDEPDPGVFLWLLIESKESATEYGELAVAKAPYGTYTEALDAGVLELKRLANYRDGPRSGER